MTTTEPELTFTPVTSIPALVRISGEGREKIKWEEKLAPIKNRFKPGEPPEAFITWTYEKKSAATSRVAAIRNRLFNATPEDNWTLAVRPVPGSDPLAHGVYVQYNGVFTDEEVAVNAKARAERSQRIHDAAAAKKAAESAVGEEAPIETPAQRVANAKKAQGK